MPGCTEEHQDVLGRTGTYWDVLGRTTTLQPTAEEPGATGTSWGRGRTRWASVWPRGVTRGCHHGGVARGGGTGATW